MEASSLLGPPHHERLQGELSLHQLALKPLVESLVHPFPSSPGRWVVLISILHVRRWVQ